MADHDHVAVRLDSRLEWKQFLFPDLFQCLCYEHGSIMGVFRGVAVSWKMFQCRRHSARMKALHRGGDQNGRLLEIVAVGPVSNHRVLRIRPHIRHRRHVGVKAQCAHVGGNRTGIFIGYFHSLVLVIQHRADHRRI